MNQKDKGIALPAAIAALLVIMVLLPALVTWLQQDSKMSIKELKSALAFNLAESGVDRGMWKLKSSTSTFDNAKSGVAIAGYNFDTTYSDIEGGQYRIRFSSGPASNEVTVTAEGKDLGSNQIRAIQAVYRNSSIPGAMISESGITWANAFSAHWGPIMAHNNINITDAKAAQEYYPRKFSRQVVQTTIGSYNRDTNGIDPPNTDNEEWWSDYPVPELPILDFETLRASAAATGTLNVFGCSKMKSGISGSPWWGSNKCNLGGSNHTGLTHFQNNFYHPDALKNYVWYWDDDLNITGQTGSRGSGLWGSVIVRGDLTNWAGDNYYFTGPVPENAWKEYAKISKSAGDTSSTNEYPADIGYQKVNATFDFGGETWSGGPYYKNTDVGFRGLIYVGGDLNIEGPADINGAVWVVGSVSKAVGAERTIIFFDDSLDLPTLNVVLVRESWDEIAPDTSAWP